MSTIMLLSSLTSSLSSLSFLSQVSHKPNSLSFAQPNSLSLSTKVGVDGSFDSREGVNVFFFFLRFFLFSFNSEFKKIKIK